MRDFNRKAIALMSVVALLLSACDSNNENPNKNPSTDVVEHTKKLGVMDNLIENGVVDLPGKPGYKVRQYINYHHSTPSHYLYLVEKDGVPVSGMAESHSNGKAGELTIAVQVAGGKTVPGGRTIECVEIAECKKILAEIDTEEEERRKYEELKKKYEPQKAQVTSQ